MATAGSPRVADPGEPKRDKRMSLGQHLVELRKRLMFAALALIVGMVVAFFITDWVIYLITGPIRDIAATEGDSAKVELMFDTVTGAPRLVQADNSGPFAGAYVSHFAFHSAGRVLATVARDRTFGGSSPSSSSSTVRMNARALSSVQ